MFSANIIKALRELTPIHSTIWLDSSLFSNSKLTRGVDFKLVNFDCWKREERVFCVLLPCTFQIIHFKLYISNCTFQIITFRIVHFKLYISNYTFRILHFKLYISHRAFHTSAEICASTKWGVFFGYALSLPWKWFWLMAISVIWVNFIPGKKTLER